MNSAQPDPRLAELAAAWTQRSWARAALTGLVCTGVIIMSGNTGGPIGYLLFAMVGAVCVLYLADSRRRLASFLKAPPPGWVTIDERDRASLRVGAWAGYVPALAISSKLASQPFQPAYAVALVLFLGAALFVQLVLARRPKERRVGTGA
jgi:hypothetical protein